MTYRLCKQLIENGNYDKDDMLVKLDVFLLNNRISQEEYEELVGLLEDQSTHNQHKVNYAE